MYLVTTMKIIVFYVRANHFSYLYLQAKKLRIVFSNGALGIHVAHAQLPSAGELSLYSKHLRHIHTFVGNMINLSLCTTWKKCPFVSLEDKHLV